MNYEMITQTIFRFEVIKRIEKTCEVKSTIIIYREILQREGNIKLRKIG